METVNVDLGSRSYPIYIGPRLLEQGELLRRHLVARQVAVVTNDVVADLYLDRLLKTLDGLSVDVYVVPDGEQHKTLATFSSIVDFLVDERHNRTTTLVALGGGVVGDLCGFVAAAYQRGVGFVQIPTTLLAQVDSSVGGKTGVNHAKGKNLIGAFHQPRAVIADIGLLGSLPPREFAAGLAEVLKYGVIADPRFFQWIGQQAAALVDRDTDVLTAAVRRSCEIKADVVAADEREVGRRAILNYGHTFGHALETLTGYGSLLHGEAVAIGMVMAADLSARLGWLSGADAARIKHVVSALGLPTAPPPVVPAEMLRAMGMDKKVSDGVLRLVLAKGIGEVVVTDQFDHDALHATLAARETLCDG